MRLDRFRYMLWEQDRDGTWRLRCRDQQRGPVEEEVNKMPPAGAAWMFVSQDHGFLAESIRRV